MKIDVHAHYYPPEYIREMDSLDDDSATAQAWRGFRSNFKSSPIGRSVEEGLAAMDSSGVDVEVLSLSIPNVYFADAAKSQYLAQMCNDTFAEVCRQHKDRFWALASIPLEFPDLAVEEMHRAIERLGMCGLAIGANIRGKPLNSPEFRPVFEEADRLNLAILIHPMIPPGLEVLDEYHMDSSFGYLFDSATAATRLIFSGLFEKCRNLKMIIPHMGGIIPFNIERVDFSFQARAECRANIPLPPSAYFKRLYYDSANYHRPAVRCGYESFGAEHLVLGSDFPFRRDGGASAIANIASLGLSPDEEALIYGGNAQRIFGREGR